MRRAVTQTTRPANTIVIAAERLAQRNPAIARRAHIAAACFEIVRPLVRPAQHLFDAVIRATGATLIETETGWGGL